MKKKKLLNFAFMGLIGASLLGLGGKSFADTTDTTHISQSIIGGSRDIQITPTATFQNVTLDGATQQTTADPGNFSLTDASGTGVGYHVTAEATQFQSQAPVGGFQSGTSARTLPQGSLDLSTEGSTISANGTTSALPTWQGNDFVIDSGTPVTILSASPDAGMGKYNIQFGNTALKLTLNPATTYIDNINFPSSATPYQSDITYTIVTGP